MKIKNVNFETWLKNHSEDHNDKWYRELLPFEVFEKIDFDSRYVGRIQQIKFKNISYLIKVNSIHLQERGTYISAFSIETNISSKFYAWKKRDWNTNFKIVFSPDYEFISAFAKNEDPSKELVKRFMKGNLNKVSEARSLPVSDLLFRTLLIHLAEENFENGSYRKSFKCEPEGIRNLPIHVQFKRKATTFSPLFSEERNLWICHSFSEEKAHRIAFQMANQALKFIIVYCNPTYTRHHRCNYENTLIISIYEFTKLLNPDIRKKYEFQIRFLQNHMNQPKVLTANELLEEIENPSKDNYPIEKSSIMEALAIMKIEPTDESDYFHCFSALNLINSFVNVNKKTNINNKLFRDMYFFKTYLSKHLESLLQKPCENVDFYIDDNLVIVFIKGFKFSFHNVPLSPHLIEYKQSNLNTEIQWEGKRLQPLAQLIFDYSKASRVCQAI